MVQENSITEKPRYMAVGEWVKRVGYFSEGGVRHLIFSNDDFNTRVVRRVGRKILLDVRALDEWIAEQTATNKN